MTKPLGSRTLERGVYEVDRTGPAYLSLEGSSMHREVGDRTTSSGDDHRSGTVPGSHRLRDDAAYRVVGAA
jgi:hypothetical protein